MFAQVGNQRTPEVFSIQSKNSTFEVSFCELFAERTLGEQSVH